MTEKIQKVEDIAYYVLFAVLYIRQFLRTTMFTVSMNMKILDLIGYAAAGLLVPLALYNVYIFWKKDRKIALLLAAVLVSGVGSLFIGKNRTLIILCVLIVSSVGRKLEIIAKISLVSGVLLMIVAYLASINGYIPYLIDPEPDGRVNLGLGILYSTDFAAHVLYLAMTYVWLRKDKMHAYEYLLLWCANLLMWRYSGARANTGLLSLFLLCFAIMKLFEKKTRIYPKPAASVHVICAVITFILYLFRQKLSAIPAFTEYTGRLFLSETGIKRYGLSLFGKVIEENGEGGLFFDPSKGIFFLDIAYVRILLMYGVFFLAVYLIWMTFVTYRSALNQDIVLCLVLAAVALASMVEHHSIDYCYNIFLFAPVLSLVQREPITKKEGSQNEHS